MSNRSRSSRFEASRAMASNGTTNMCPWAWLMAACGMVPSGRGSRVTAWRLSVPVEIRTTSPVTSVTVRTVGGPTRRERVPMGSVGRQGRCGEQPSSEGGRCQASRGSQGSPAGPPAFGLWVGRSERGHAGVLSVDATPLSRQGLQQNSDAGLRRAATLYGSRLRKQLGVLTGFWEPHAPPPPGVVADARGTDAVGRQGDAFPTWAGAPPTPASPAMRTRAACRSTSAVARSLDSLVRGSAGRAGVLRIAAVAQLHPATWPCLDVETARSGDARDAGRLGRARDPPAGLSTVGRPAHQGPQDQPARGPSSAADHRTLRIGAVTGIVAGSLPMPTDPITP